jgi:hypothetical protein
MVCWSDILEKRKALLSQYDYKTTSSYFNMCINLKIGFNRV